MCWEHLITCFFLARYGVSCIGCPSDYMPWRGNLQICKLSDEEGDPLDDDEPRAAAIPRKPRSVGRLSDDEGPPGEVASFPKSHVPPVSQPLRIAPAAIRARLGKLSISLCGCARQAKRKGVSSCFRQFQGAGMDGILRLVLDLGRLSKHDMDKKVRGSKSQLISALQVHFSIHPTSFFSISIQC